MLMPYRTLADPEVQGEGSIDPLGLATMADHLGDWILPGMTARMWRPRFLTAMAATSVIVAPLAEEVAKDGVSPPWLVLEWYYVEAMAGVTGTDLVKLRRIPGIDKARQARRDSIAMNADRYLKTPKVFGFHGVYRRLARHADVVDDDLALGANGHRLLRIWEVEQGLVGFSDPERLEGEGAKIRRTLREPVAQALASGQTERGRSWAGGTFFVEHLAAHDPGPREAEFLWQLLNLDGAEPRGEVVRLMSRPEVRRAFRETESERKALRDLRPDLSPELGRRIDAIEGYEAFCRPLQETWDRLRHLATLKRPSLVRVDDLVADPRADELAHGLPEALRQARGALAESPIVSDFERLASQFEHVRTPAELMSAIWDHHVQVQAGKPPEGKRPWFEQLTDGGLVVRAPYRLDDAPSRDDYVHPYRLFAVASFIDDLRGPA